MHNVKKNQIVVVLLVVMIVVAGYLNYRSGNAEEVARGRNDSVLSTQTMEDNDSSGETALLEWETDEETADADVTADGVLLPEGTETASGDDMTAAAADGETAGAEEQMQNRAPGEAVMVESDAVVPEYFAQAKVERENARAKSQDMLYDLMAQVDTPEEAKSEAAQQILELQKRIENEAAAEAMIKAKGFDEAYVRIYDDCVDVIVDRQEITQQEAAQIQDIITRITGLGADKIRISLLKVGA